MKTAFLQIRLTTEMKQRVDQEAKQRKMSLTDLSNLAFLNLFSHGRIKELPTQADPFIAALDHAAASQPLASLTDDEQVALQQHIRAKNAGQQKVISGGAFRAAINSAGKSPKRVKKA